ncbi:MAG: hypothetical protein AB8F65_13230 [Woeseiaceae bacterium]
MSRKRLILNLTAVGALVALSGCANTGTPIETEVAEDVPITGSLIKRDVEVKQVNTDSAQRVRILDKEELKRSSGTTVGDALRASGIK